MSPILFLSIFPSLVVASSLRIQSLISQASENDRIILQDMTEKTAGNHHDNSDLLLSLDAASGQSDDVYVVHYDLTDIGTTGTLRLFNPLLLTNLDSKQAKEEVNRLIQDCTAAGLQSAVRIGAGCTLLIILKAPRKLLGNAVHRSRFVTERI